MISTSADFKRAIYEQSPREKMLVRFIGQNVFFNNEDIDISSGVRITEAINYEEELTIGSCVASTLSCSIFNIKRGSNNKRLLSDFKFGEAEVQLGVRIKTDKFTTTNEANCALWIDYPMQTVDGSYPNPTNVTVFEGWSTPPYLRLRQNGQYTNVSQPPFPIHAMMADGSILYCIGIDGRVWTSMWLPGDTWDSWRKDYVNWDGLKNSNVIWDSSVGVLITPELGSVWADMTIERWKNLSSLRWQEVVASKIKLQPLVLNEFMKEKAIRWANEGRAVKWNDGVEIECYTDGTVERYEYVPLGTFLMKTPNKRNVDMIDIDTTDRMSLFDEDASDWVKNLNFSSARTLGWIFQQMCAQVGVEIASSSVSFLNSGLTFTKNPMLTYDSDGNVDNPDLIYRDILRWIAEAACAMAKFDRFGKLNLVFFDLSVKADIGMNKCFSQDVTEHKVSQINQLETSTPSNGSYASLSM